MEQRHTETKPQRTGLAKHRIGLSRQNLAKLATSKDRVSVQADWKDGEAIALQLPLKGIALFGVMFHTGVISNAFLGI
jgi:hypothetical protein